MSHRLDGKVAVITGAASGMGAAAAAGTPPKLGAAPPQSFREEALRRAMEDPATAALVLRHWLGTAVDERSPGAMG